MVHSFDLMGLGFEDTVKIFFVLCNPFYTAWILNFCDKRISIHNWPWATQNHLISSVTSSTNNERKFEIFTIRCSYSLIKWDLHFWVVLRSLELNFSHKFTKWSKDRRKWVGNNTFEWMEKFWISKSFAPNIDYSDEREHVVNLNSINFKYRNAKNNPLALCDVSSVK